jgi:threonine/homoserine/homoserine lactone efflux protein
MTHLGGFLVLAAAVICTPGPDTALTIRNTLGGGRANGVRTAAGVALGQAAWTLSAAAGIAALIAASHPLFVAIRLAGAAYLVYLGLQTLRGRGASGKLPLALGGSGFRQGLVSNLGNPKMAIFFTSLLPQFAGSGFASLLAFGLLFSLLTLTWLSAYAVAVARAGRVLARPRLRRALDVVTGTALAAFGLRLAAE